MKVKQYEVYRCVIIQHMK